MNDGTCACNRSDTGLLFFWRGFLLTARFLACVLASLLLAMLAAFPLRGQSKAPSNPIIAIDASSVIPAVSSKLRMGGKSSDGREIRVNSQFLTLDGNPWLPVMGEFHFSRYPENYWEEEILKMKAGGVQIVSTYIFWIHHEEVQGQFDWSGQRNLRHFVELCASHQMYVSVRIGPWVHGEARNGGLPDWVLKQGPTRRDDPLYLASVRRFYGQIGKQLAGLFWKDGGPIIDVQIENEYRETGPGAGAGHISTLKKIALESGLNTPVYTVTGWDDAIYPPDEVIPVFGAYPDGFWSGDLTDLPANDAYLFSLRRVKGQQNAPYEKFNIPDDKLSPYPYFVAEGGGGMETSYHRRPVLTPDDIAVNTLTQIGSGANLYGYYMFHGGINPEGKLSTLQESSDTGYPNDLPVVSYDFQAPLGKYGQMHPSFRRLKLLHLFLEDFGSELAPMTAHLPASIPTDPADPGPPRFAVRANGDHAFLFFNNYVRQHPLPERKHFQVSIKLASDTVAVPRNPVDIPPDAYFIWPINLDMHGPRLKYSTSQLLCSTEWKGSTYYFFFAIPGIAPEFLFDPHTLDSLETATGKEERSNEWVSVAGISPGPQDALTLHSAGKTIHVVVLSRDDAENIWKFNLGGKEEVFLTPSDTFADGNAVHLRARAVHDLDFGVFPDIAESANSTGLTKSPSYGLFTEYQPAVQPRTFNFRWTKTAGAGPLLPLRMAKSVPWRSGAVAAPPTDSDFEHAASWQIAIPSHTTVGLSDAFLRIHYVGDVGRLYAHDHIADDDFYKGTAWEIGLKRFGISDSDTNFQLRIMPLHQNEPIYLPKDSWPNLGSNHAIAEIQNIELVPEYEVVVTEVPNQ